MYSWKNFVDKFKRNWKLEAFEVRGLIITCLLIAFIFSFREWGTTSFDWKMGSFNYFRAIILVGTALLVHEFGHRLIATWIGYHSQYKAWLMGLVAGLVLAFVSNGFLLFLAPGTLLIKARKVHRLGTWPFGSPLHRHLGWIAMSGAIANMVFAILLKTIYFAIPNPWILKAVTINIWLALFNMIPIPPFNGIRTFFGSRFIYVFVVGCMFGAAAILTWTGGILSVIGALFVGTLLLFVFFGYVDKRFNMA